jgi:pyruvate dehydrogenase E1 component
MSTQDIDPLETQEWLEAFKSVARVEGDDRAKFLLNKLMDMAHQEATSYKVALEAKEAICPPKSYGN